MGENKTPKINILDTPYPKLFVMPFQMIGRMLFRGKELPKLSDKVLRVLLIVLALVSFVVIWMFEGFVNPFDLMVDLPFFDFNEIPADYQMYYLVFLPFFTMLALSILGYIICRREEFPLFSVNGIMYWLTTVAVSILVEAFVRNVFIEKYHVLYEELYRLSKTDLKAAVCHLLMLIVLISALYFALSDFASSVLSIAITPYLLIFLGRFENEFPILQNTLFVYLVVTLLLKIVLYFLEKIGMLSKITGTFIKYGYTPRYMARIYFVMLCIMVPPLIIVYLVMRKNKKIKS